MLVCAQAVGSRLLARSAAAERATEYIGIVWGLKCKYGREAKVQGAESKEQGAWMRGQTQWGEDVGLWTV